MNRFEFIPTLLVVVAFIMILISGSKHLKNKLAELDKAEELKREKALKYSLGYPLAGLLIFGMTLFSWQTMPPDKELLYSFYLSLGFAMIVFGLYKWRQLSKEN